VELGDKGNEHRADVVGSNLNGTPARRVSDLDDFVLLVHAHLHDRGLVHLHAFEQHRDRAVAAMGQAAENRCRLRRRGGPAGSSSSGCLCW